MSSKASPFLENDSSFATKAIHAGSQNASESLGAVAMPIYLSTNFKQDPPPDHGKGYTYSRGSNPNRDGFQENFAALEGAKYGLAFSSGVSACYLVLHLLNQGDHVVTLKSMYHGIYNMFKHQTILKMDVDFVDATSVAEFKKALRPDTKLVWLESPTNPMLNVIDIKAVVDLVRSKSPNAIVTIDNTFQTPYFQRPLSLGADIVMHSCTKYIIGHSDSLAGFLATNREDLYTKLKTMSISFGPTPSSFDCYLLMRSLKTLEIRMQRHMSNALALAQFLEKHPGIDKVLYPGLPSHPHYEITLRQCYGTSGMVSFYIKEHDFAISTEFLRQLKVVLVADSLGGVETTVKMVSQMPISSLTEEENKELKYTDGLMRMSVGLESPQDLISDIDQALQKAFKAAGKPLNY